MTMLDDHDGGGGGDLGLKGLLLTSSSSVF